MLATYLPPDQRLVLNQRWLGLDHPLIQSDPALLSYRAVCGVLQYTSSVFYRLALK
jgi:hypothetical protein